MATVAGCQSISGRSPDIEPLSNAPHKPLITQTKFPIPNRSPVTVRKAAPVKLTGLVTEEPTESADVDRGNPGEDPDSRANSQGAADRDIRPIFVGQNGLRDPNAALSQGSRLRQTSGETEPPPKMRAGLLLGDDPDKLFRGQDAQESHGGVEGDPFHPLVNRAPRDQSELPPFLLPQPTAAETAAANESGYDQALTTPPAPFTLRSDLQCLGPTLWDDTKSIFTWQNAAVIVVGAGGAVALRETGVDNDVRNYTLGHEQRWGGFDNVLRQFGDPMYQVPVIAGIYGYSMWKQDTGLHDYSRALISGYSLSALATVAIKGIADTSRPTPYFSDGHYGFPSFHTSSLFAIGGITEEYYGCCASVPIYVLGGLVGWSRIDQREHDLSDVVFGAVMGYVIGKSVGANHRQHDGDRKWNVQPYYDPQNGVNGVTLETRF